MTQVKKSARLPHFYRQSMAQRWRRLQACGWLSPDEHRQLQQGAYTLSPSRADGMLENVIGVFGLPWALGLNFLINAREWVVPLVVEEPSIVAALGAAAKLVRQSGGFTVHSSAPLLIGQIQVVEVPQPQRAQRNILQHRQAILDLANSLHPKMVARGGGAQEVEVRWLPSQQASGGMLVVHLLVDTCDAMGANLVNTMCEGVAGLIEELSRGRVFLRILSNLTDRAMVTARAVIPVAHLEDKNYAGAQVRDGIVLANDFALLDPYRATTHNKGIMNGIDAVAVATGNDWRALEAAAHAYAGRGTSYTALTRWYVDAQGQLNGELQLPLKVGTVGGNLLANPAVRCAQRLLGDPSARQLAEVMGAVGLAQNFAALRALSSEGIQSGHMSLHARAVVMAAGAPPELFDTVVQQVVESGDVKLWKARDILTKLQRAPRQKAPVSAAVPLHSLAFGHGKVLLLGEHAVVYGRHALAAPLPLGVRARVQPNAAAPASGVHLLIPAWGVEGHLRANETQNTLHASLSLILKRLQLAQQSLVLEVFPEFPRAMGLGGSAALAVAVIRALDRHFGLALPDAEVNALAYETEKLAHGTPSGVDNTLATYGKLLLFQRTATPTYRFIDVPMPVPLVVAHTGVESLTAKMVAQVARLQQQNRRLYEKIFDDIDALVLAGAAALQQGNLAELGDCLNINQGLLNALQVSSWELEELIGVARQHGALGAKLTGSGGGGAIVALCEDDTAASRVTAAIRQAGYQAWQINLARPAAVLGP